MSSSHVCKAIIFQSKSGLFYIFTRKHQFTIDINSIKFNVLSPFKTMIENYLKRRVFFFFVDTFFGNTEMIQSFK